VDFTDESPPMLAFQAVLPGIIQTSVTRRPAPRSNPAVSTYGASSSPRDMAAEASIRPGRVQFLALAALTPASMERTGSDSPKKPCWRPRRSPRTIRLSAAAGRHVHGHGFAADRAASAGQRRPRKRKRCSHAETGICLTSSQKLVASSPHQEQC